MIRESPYRLPVAALGVLTVLVLTLPLLVVIALSFTQSREMQFPPVGFSPQWYSAVLSDPAWHSHLLASLAVGIGSATLATTLGLFTALALVRGRFPGKRLLWGFTLLPLVVPTVVIGIGMYFVWVLGWQVGSVSVGSGLAGTALGIMLAHAALTYPLPVVIISVSLLTVDRNLELAAATLGSGPVATFRRVTAPLIAPGILFGFVFAFLGSWDEYVVASFLSSADITTVPVALFNQIRFAIDPTAAAVSALLLAMSTVILCLVLFRGGYRPVS
jgi:putative spermidine/putrescine transport system permease protein